MLFPLARNTSRKAPPRRTPTAALRLETLEPRVVFDAGVGVAGRLLPSGVTLQDDGVLQIRGDQRHDAALVWIDDGVVRAKLEQTEFKKIGRFGSPVPITQTKEASFPAASVQKIVFTGLAGNDSFKNLTKLPSEAYGGSGDDSLVGGAGPDLLNGGTGHDQLEGREGDDLLEGGSGDDRYVFAGDKLGSDSIVEAPNKDVDTLDFSQFAEAQRNQIGGGWSLADPLPVEVDLAKFGPQVVNPDDLTLSLSNSGAIENVIGGGASDTIFGNGRINRLEGRGGNDTLDGRSAKDRLEGGWGDDTLYGGHGDDELYGGGGHDLLRGGAGKDLLFGEAGNDSLLGGPDVDKIYGGGGFDRFLQQQHFKNGALFNEDQLLDLAPADDAVSFFADTLASVAFGWNWGAGKWTEAEIVKTDVALDQMHRRTGNVKLLERADGSSLTYFRWGALGAQDDPQADPAPLAWNSGGNLHFPDKAVNSDLDWYLQVVQHETGHNWGNASLANWNEFLALSDWQKWDPAAPYDTDKYVLTTAYDETWIRDKSAAFANNYGKGHPWEDFATAFESYFAQYAGREFTGDGVEPIPAKWAFMDEFFDSLM